MSCPHYLYFRLYKPCLPNTCTDTGISASGSAHSRLHRVSSSAALTTEEPDLSTAALLLKSYIKPLPFQPVIPSLSISIDKFVFTLDFISTDLNVLTLSLLTLLMVFFLILLYIMSYGPHSPSFIIRTNRLSTRILLRITAFTKHLLPWCFLSYLLTHS